MKFLRLLSGLLLLLAMLPSGLKAQDGPMITIDNITDRRGNKVDEKNAPYIIHVTGTAVNARDLRLYLVVNDGNTAWIQSTIGLGHISSNVADFFGHCTLGTPQETSSIARSYRVFAVVTDIEYERDQKLDKTTVIARSHSIALLRPVSPPQRVVTPQPATMVKAAPRDQSAPTSQTVSPAQAVMTARIISPRQGASIGRKIPVEGVIAGLRPRHHVFLCLQSTAFGHRIYPQGKVIPDATGQWAVESIYATPGYNYETFLVITTDTASAALLNEQRARYYGIPHLPASTERLGTTITVRRE
jgi:hypothetical protein